MRLQLREYYPLSTLNTLFMISISSLYTTSASPSNYIPPAFPYPHIGFNLTEWVDHYNNYQDATTNNLSIGELALSSPHLSIDANLLFLNLSDLPGLGTSFDTVTGIRDSQLRWFVEAPNRTETDPVILYFHGGGYIWGLFPQFLRVLEEIYEGVNSPNLSILMLDYTLTENEKFPYQLKEAAAVYNALLTTTSNIILLGDSSGAHLAIELLAHMRRPFPTVPKLPLNTAVKALAALSPWVDWNVNSTDAKLYNMMGIEACSNETFLKSRRVNIGTDTDLPWTKVLPPDVFVTYGETEPLRASIEKFIEIAGISNSSVYMEPEGIHDGILNEVNNGPILPRLITFLKKAINVE